MKTPAYADTSLLVSLYLADANTSAALAINTAEVPQIVAPRAEPPHPPSPPTSP